MKKTIYLKIVILIAIITVVACAPAGNQLAGTGGLDATQLPVVEGEPPAEPPPAELPPADVPPADVPPADIPPAEINVVPVETPVSNESLADAKIIYEKPHLIKDFTHSTNPNSDLKLAYDAMGVGNYQVTFFKKIIMGNTERIQLIITPPTVSLNKSKSLPEQSDFQVIQGLTDVYPFMFAELVTSKKIEVTSDGYPKKPVISATPTEWNWLITPLESGDQTILLNVSIDAYQSDNPTQVQLLQLFLNITTEDIPTPISSATLPSITSQLQGSATEITLATLTIFGSIVITLIGIYVPYQLNKRKKEQEQEKRRKKAKEEKDKKTLSETPFGPKKK